MDMVFGIVKKRSCDDVTQERVKNLDGRLRDKLQEKTRGIGKIVEENIRDKNKQDSLGKALALAQTTLFVVQCIARGPLAEIELRARACVYATLSVTIYIYWYHKPIRVDFPIIIRSEIPYEEGEVQEIDTSKPDPRRDIHTLAAKRRLRRRLTDFPKKFPRKLVRAKYSWDGEIMAPSTKGLSLTRGALFEISQSERHARQPGWLYGSQVYRNNWRPFSLKKGYFPETFVSVVSDEKLSEATDNTTTEIPPLPLFRFPPASGMEFDMPIGDHGHSFLKLTAEYNCKSCPTDPTHVTFKLRCSTHGSRRISSVSMFITIPECAVLDVQVCKLEAHLKEIEADQEIIENRTKAKYFNGVNIGVLGTTAGAQAGALKKHSIDSTERGSKIFRRTAEVEISKRDTIFWNLKAPMTKLDYEGLNGVEAITLILKKKPATFMYKCRVTHVKDGALKTMERTFKT